MIFALLYLSLMLVIFVLSLRKFTKFTIWLLGKLTLPIVKYDVSEVNLENLSRFEAAKKHSANQLFKNFSPPKRDAKSHRIINIGERSSEEILAGKADFGTRRIR